MPSNKIFTVKRLPNWTELNKSSLRRTTLELFDYFCILCCKKFGLIEQNFKMNWIWCNQVMKIKNFVKFIGSGTIRRDKRIELFRFFSIFNSIRSEIRLKCDSFTVELYKNTYHLFVFNYDLAVYVRRNNHILSY